MPYICSERKRESHSSTNDTYLGKLHTLLEDVLHILDDLEHLKAV